ncbi:MAG: queuosine precursor transporter [Rickettsiaceae bacterium]|nr:queuosine precursor transporter [Rickettsiaceae bacterium]
MEENLKLKQEINNTSNKKNFKYLNFINLAFVVLLIGSNLGAIKLVSFGNLILPGGIILFPMLYVLNDMLTEIYGFSISRRVIWSALFFNIFLTLILYIIVLLPPAPEHSNHEAFAKIFSFAPRIVMASLTSYFFGELLNAYALSHLKIIFKGKNFALRAILSTCVGAFLETLVFATIAFGHLMNVKMLIHFAATLTLTKVLYELLLLPFTIIITRYLKKIEGVDSYEKPSLKAVFNLK